MANDKEYGILQVDVITPEKIFFSGKASMVVVPGMLGEFGVLPGHAPFISLLKPGVIVIDSDEGQKKIAVAEGISEATADHCTVLADSAIDCSGLTAVRHADARMEQAKAALATAETDEERQAAGKKLALAEATWTWHSKYL